jgi:hypothetical protein
VANDAKLSLLELRHEHRAVWQKRQTPGLHERRGHHDDSDFVLLGRVEDEGTVAEGLARDANRGTAPSSAAPAGLLRRRSGLPLRGEADDSRDESNANKSANVPWVH